MIEVIIVYSQPVGGANAPMLFANCRKTTKKKKRWTAVSVRFRLSSPEPKCLSSEPLGSLEQTGSIEVLMFCQGLWILQSASTWSSPDRAERLIGSPVQLQQHCIFLLATGSGAVQT